MIEVAEDLFVSSRCHNAHAFGAVVHACKTPCHQNALGYVGKLEKDHPGYLHHVDGQNLYLNMIDPPVPLFPDDLFRHFGRFMRERKAEKVIIHCNQGKSRSPSLALLWMAKHLGDIPDDSFLAAREAFESIYPAYAPGKGIAAYLTANWRRLDDILHD